MLPHFRPPPALENKRTEPDSKRTGCEESRTVQQIFKAEHQINPGELKDSLSTSSTLKTDRSRTKQDSSCSEKPMVVHGDITVRDCNKTRKRKKDNKNAEFQQKDKEEGGLRLRDDNVNDREMPGNGRTNIPHILLANGLIRENSDELPDIIDVKSDILLAQKILNESLSANTLKDQCGVTSKTSSPSHYVPTSKKRPKKPPKHTRPKTQETSHKSKNGTETTSKSPSIDIVQFARSIGKDIAHFLRDHNLVATRRPYLSTSCSLSQFKQTHRKLYKRARKRAALPEEVLNDLINFLCSEYRKWLVSSEQLLAHVQRLEDVCDYVISRMDEYSKAKDRERKKLKQETT